jgi:hypothetical protein
MKPFCRWGQFKAGAANPYLSMLEQVREDQWDGTCPVYGIDGSDRFRWPHILCLVVLYHTTQNIITVYQDTKSLTVLQAIHNLALIIINVQIVSGSRLA